MVTLLKKVINHEEIILYWGGTLGCALMQGVNNQQRMNIINSGKFKHRKRVATETHSFSLHTETSTAQIVQPLEMKKKPYRYLHIDTIKELPASRSPPQSKSLSRNQHPSSESLRIHKIRSIINIPAVNEQQRRKSLRYPQQKRDEERNAEEGDRSLNAAYADKQIKRRKLRQRVERAERESERTEMQMTIVNLQEQFDKLRNAMHSIGKGMKNGDKQLGLLFARNRNASVRIIVRCSARILQRNIIFFFEGLLKV